MIFTFTRMTPDDDEDDPKPTVDMEVERERQQFLARWERYQAILARDAKKRKRKKEQAHV